MSSHANSRPDAFDVVLVGQSVRALARSARRAGLRALALDLFADADTREHAAKAVRVDGLGAAPVLATLSGYAPAGLPVVLGAGFEHAPKLMAELARRNPIRGAAPETVARLKDPASLAALLRTLGVAHPDVAAAGGAGWLSKRVGASGGAHIRPAADSAGRGRYAQRHVAGAPFSALFLADGRRAVVVGFSEQWTDPTPARPYRYGGAVGPVAVPPDRAAAVAAALSGIVAATGLVGLASADMLALPSGAGFVLLEINPRPGATLDLFDAGAAPSLLAAHLDACGGALPDAWPDAEGARAMAVVYATRACAPGRIERPAWTADWPADDRIVPRGAPVCTVLAAAAGPEAARALVETRRAALLAALHPSRRVAASPLLTTASS